MSEMLDKLLNLELPVPETMKIRLPRLDLTFTLRELSYDKVTALRKEPEDATLHYLLEAVTEPNLRDARWFRDKMDCPTPIAAMKRLLRIGEIERLAKAADTLNGYGPGSVLIQNEKQVEETALGAAVEELRKN